MIKNNRDFVFIFDATNTNPNGDADQENKPRFDSDTKTLLVSDVRRKRDIRDFLFNKGHEIFVRTLNDTKVTMEMMFTDMKNRFNISDKASEDEIVNCILNNMLDIRLFGSAMAIKKVTKTFTGPIQLTWGYSLHPVDLVKSNTIVTIMSDENSTFGNIYKAHYAMVAHSGSLNKFAAMKTRLTEEDFNLFRAALIQSMMNNLTQSKIGQEPLLYLEVEYSENFDGYLGDLRRYLNISFEDKPMRNISQIEIDFSKITDATNELKKKGFLKAVNLWINPLVTTFKNLPDAEALDLVKPLE